MFDFGLRPRGDDVGEEADDPLQTARHADLGGAQQGNLGQAEVTGRGGGEATDEIGRHREDDADHVGRREVVAAENLVQHAGGGGQDGPGVVAVDLDRSANGPDRGRVAVHLASRQGWDVRYTEAASPRFVT
jgi:hypothetical protein